MTTNGPEAPEPAQFLVAHAAALPPLVPVSPGRWVNPAKLVAVVPRADEKGDLVIGGCVCVMDDGMSVGCDWSAEHVATVIRQAVEEW